MPAPDGVMALCGARRSTSGRKTRALSSGEPTASRTQAQEAERVLSCATAHARLNASSRRTSHRRSTAISIFLVALDDPSARLLDVLPQSARAYDAFARKVALPAAVPVRPSLRSTHACSLVAQVWPIRYRHKRQSHASASCSMAAAVWRRLNQAQGGALDEWLRSATSSSCAK